jgi:hypothetical protein
MAKDRSTRRYAQDLVDVLRNDMERISTSSAPSIDFAEVIQSSPNIVVSPYHLDVDYQEDDLIFNIDPSTLSVGDVVVIGHDPSWNPVIISISDANNEDPFASPGIVNLRNDLISLRADTKYWREPVNASVDLPEDASLNINGDVRLVVSEEAFYYWDGSTNTWNQLASGGGAFVDEAGDTMTGDLIMSSGTKITLPDAPTLGTDAANKDYVDSVVSGASFATLLKFGNS